MIDESVFAAALAIPDTQVREACLEEVCTGNPDVATWTERLTVPHPGMNSVEFTADDWRLLTAGRGVRRWPVGPMAEAGTRRPRELTEAERT